MSEDVEDLTASLREAQQHGAGHAVEVGDAALDGSPAGTEPHRQLGAQVRLVEVSGGAGVRVQVARVEGAPPAVGALRGVGDDHVCVELRVAGAAGAMSERGADQPVTRLFFGTGVASADERGVTLEVAESGVDRRLVPLDDLVGDGWICEAPQQRNGLRC